MGSARQLRREFHVDDTSVKDVDEVTELHDVLVDALDVEVLVLLVLW